MKTALISLSPPGGERIRERGPDLLARALADQQALTAVDLFSRKHDELPANAQYYRDLIPASPARPGQQYAFEVDLDACTGCKACVTGCHNLNGLDDGEVWRTVGLLHGGAAAAPIQQTITTACHHCLEPACMLGCPVQAYEKDPTTGIVKHLDDQCIGCQYCVLMCPYDAPKFSAARGIVRKCDMCSDRLAHGEAPACVQSCPNQAIRITVVERADAARAAEAEAFLPGAPSPRHTQPTTVYKKKARPWPEDMLPGAHGQSRAEQAHPPLSIMLVLTQLSVGAFVLGGFAPVKQAVAALLALVSGALAMAVMPLHLGRPRYAFRALLGLRTSWLSREVLAFSLYLGLLGAYIVARARPLWVATAIAGALGVLCSVMVYAATRREHWRASLTGCKFVLSAAILGASAMLALSGPPPPYLTWLVLLATVVKLAVELTTGPVSLARFGLALIGGVLLPALHAFPVAAWLCCLAGELVERHRFFAAAPPSRMPGAIG